MRKIKTRHTLRKACACISCYLALIPPCIYCTISIIRKLQHNFPKMRGVEDRLEFFRNFIRFGAAILPLPLHLITGLKNVKLIIWWTLTAIQNDHPAFDTYLGHVSSAWQFTFLFPLRRPGWKCRMTSVIFIISYMEEIRGFPSSAESDPYERGRNIPLTNQYGTARWKHLDEVTWSLSEVSNEATHKI